MNKTKKWFTSLGVALTLTLTIGCSTLPLRTPGDIPPQVVAWAQTNVWKVVEEYGHGSAFFINNKQLITACHVVNDVLDGVTTFTTYLHDV